MQTIRKAKVICFDYGLKRIGVAVADTEAMHAEPLIIIENKNAQLTWKKIDHVVEDWEPFLFVVGKAPGSNINHSIDEFSTELKKRYQLDVIFSNEAYTSVEAKQRLNDMRRLGCHKKLKRDELDKFAAVLILEDWLSSISSAP